MPDDDWERLSLNSRGFYGVQGSGEFGAGGWDRDNRCGECGIAMGQIHLSGCRTGIAMAEGAVRAAAQGRLQNLSPDAIRALGQQRISEFHPDILRELGLEQTPIPPHASYALGHSYNESKTQPGTCDVGIDVPCGRRADEHRHPTEIRSHGPADHGPEFWSSGCTDPACVAFRAEQRRKIWLLQQPEYVALSTERNEILRRLHTLAAAWDWDAWYDGEFDTANWSADAIQSIYTILGLEAPAL